MRDRKPDRNNNPRRSRGTPPAPPTEPWTGTVDRLGWGGRGIARTPDGRVILLESPLALFPGEEVDAQIALRKRHGEGFVTGWRTRDPRRTGSGCVAASVCGACDLWEAGPAAAELKQLMVADLFNRHLDGDLPWDFHAAPETARRSRIQLHWNGKRLGYHRRREWAIAAISSCPMADDAVSTAIPQLAEALRGRKLPDDPDRWELATGTPGGRVIATAEEQPGHAWELRGGAWEPTSEPLLHRFGEVSLCQSPGTFFQVYPAWAWEAFSTIFNGFGLEGRTLFDLYGGGGFFSAMLGGRFNRCVIVEGDPAAVADARANLAGRDVEFHPQDIAHWLPKQLGTDGDFVILDPPRSGLTERIGNRLKGCRASAVVLVGCDGAVFCRDIKRLAPEWQLTKLAVADLFPNTVHVECVGLLTRKVKS